MPPHNFIDLSLPLDGNTQIYPGDPPFINSPHVSFEKDGYSVRHLSLGTHTGTHIDAPYHFVADGQTIDKTPLDILISQVVVIDLSRNAAGVGLKPRERITWAHLAPHVSSFQAGRILLVNTGWSKLHYGTKEYFDHPYFAMEVARKLLAMGIKVFGTDTLNPDETPASHDQGPAGEGGDGFGFHEAFLGAGRVEGVSRLIDIALPIKRSRRSGWHQSVFRSGHAVDLGAQRTSWSSSDRRAFRRRENAMEGQLEYIYASKKRIYSLYNQSASSFTARLGPEM